MFENLYRNPETCNRHNSAPFVQERERYLESLRQRGYSESYLRQAAAQLLVVIRELGPDAVRHADVAEIQAATERFTKGRRGLPFQSETKHPGEYFKYCATDWLRFLGWLREPTPAALPYGSFLEDFCVWMRDERNLSPETIKTTRRYVNELLRWHHGRGGKIQDIKVSDVDAFLSEYGTTRWSRPTVAGSANSLRLFFRYGAMRGWWYPSIAKAIDGPIIYREENLPSGPSWDDVGRLLASLRPDDPTDIRDRAMILLLAVYGFRAGEVARLSLEDIGWEPKELLVRRSKSRTRQKYPLVAAVAEALWIYLLRRPDCDVSEVFVTTRAPFKPVSRFIIYNGVANRLRNLGVHLNHRGPHSLRHACAARLVSQGLLLKEIGDHLGHRSTAATRIYAKVDLPHLREVASFDLGGLA